ncbi:sugar ABC transporter ATP-binding protein [Thermoanaerobacteraceae bacterium SP2]|jgi:ABC-type sugar transport system ATPase subunit|nr:sugar ABC transporter ATP-binding protein [Thermoanaerobacteraceae bacterium SP2]
MGTILTIKNISKSFPGVKALDNVNVDFYEGEVHALVGMNGSGKSTLLKIITGALKPDSGEILVNGKVIKIHNVLDSRKLGISLVYQELSLVPYLSVAENIFLGHLPQNGVVIDFKMAKRKSRELLNEIGMEIDPDITVESLTMAEKQMVEIAKALSINAKILLLDEPSAVLSEVELEKLFRLIRTLKNKGVTIVYISHRLEEVFEIADRVTVLRDGSVVDTKDIKEIQPSDLIRMMIGRTLSELFPEVKNLNSNKKILKIKNLKNDKLSDINIDLDEGEIIGIFGAAGSGQKELAEALFGLNTKNLTFEEYTINNKSVNIKSPDKAIKHGLAYIPEERKEDGLMLGLSIRENIVITFLDKITKMFGWIVKVNENKKVTELIKNLEIKTPSPEVIVKKLSGGNQQKVVIAKWLGKDSRIFICFEPTRGIDVNAKFQVYDALEKMRRSGASVIIISSELSEVMGMSDRIYVLKKGKIVAAFKRDEFDEELILSKAIGVGV